MAAEKDVFERSLARQMSDQILLSLRVSLGLAVILHDGETANPVETQISTGQPCDEEEYRYR